MSNYIKTFDTTLRDGQQASGANLSVQDLLKYKKNSNLNSKQVANNFYYLSNNNEQFLSLIKIKNKLNFN